MNYQFGNTSLERLQTCHKELQILMKASLANSDVDFGIAVGERTVEEQRKLFKDGKSKLNPDTDLEKAKHVTTKDRPWAEAVDIYAWVNSSASYRSEHIIYLMGIIRATHTTLYNLGVLERKIRWGGNWDLDGEVVTDQTFQDLVHVELI